MRLAGSDSQYPLMRRQPFGHICLYITEKSMDGGQTLVARGDTAVASGFDPGNKRSYQVIVDMRQGQTLGRDTLFIFAEDRVILSANNSETAYKYAQEFIQKLGT